MTKKQAYKIIEKQYINIECDGYVGPLCFEIKNRKLKRDWCEYWDKINTRDYMFITSYIRSDLVAERSLIRLMILHDFIEDTYK